MIGKQKTGRGFSGVLRYTLNPQKGYLLGGNMEGGTAQELSKEFAGLRKLNPNLGKPVYHVSLSLSPEESLNDAEWTEIASKYMNEMGFAFSMYCIARHTDRQHEHIHIVASRIGLDGKTVCDSHNYRRSEQIIRRIEIDYGLVQIKSSREVDRRALTSEELRCALRTNRPSARMLLQEIIEQEAKKSLTMTTFANNLRSRGVEIIPNMASTGKISGLSFKHNGETMKGSDLGRGYTFSGILKRGIHYDMIRDNNALQLSRSNVLNENDQYSKKIESVRHIKR
jgi:hypothetical protein